MEVDILKAEHLIYKNKRSFDSLRYSYNLADAISVLKHDYSWEKGELSSTVLLNKPKKQIILTALHEGTEIVYPRSGNSFTFQVIEGNIMFYTHRRNEFLTMGETLKITEKIEFKLTTQVEAVILLTIENEG